MYISNKYSVAIALLSLPVLVFYNLYSTQDNTLDEVSDVVLPSPYKDPTSRITNSPFEVVSLSKKTENKKYLPAEFGSDINTAEQSLRIVKKNEIYDNNVISSTYEVTDPEILTVLNDILPN